MELIKFLATDNVSLDGFLYKSDSKTKDVILAVHGMSSNCFKKRDVIISEYATKNNIDYFCFNNRGSELARYLRKKIDGKVEKILAGTGYEEVSDGYYDITGAIQKLKDLGYENIYLQGHSLGCTKSIYTYQRLVKENSELLKNIKALILLSLVDVNNVLRVYLGEKYNYYLKFAEEKEKQGHLKYLMPDESFIHPISVKTYLRYIRDYGDINVDDYNIVKTLDLPLFMRWGTDHEMITYSPEEIISHVSSKINHNDKDVNCIIGADHSYHGYEEELAKQIVNFVINQKNK